MPVKLPPASVVVRERAEVGFNSDICYIGSRKQGKPARVGFHSVSSNELFKVMPGSGAGAGGGAGGMNDTIPQVN